MANRTVKDAHSIHGTNPQYLVEKIIRTRIYESKYWKEECFGLTGMAGGRPGRAAPAPRGARADGPARPSRSRAGGGQGHGAEIRGGSLWREH